MNQIMHYLIQPSTCFGLGKYIFLFVSYATWNYNRNVRVVRAIGEE